jgi:hypothetical protein
VNESRTIVSERVHLGEVVVTLRPRHRPARPIPGHRIACRARAAPI